MYAYPTAKKRLPRNGSSVVTCSYDETISRNPRVLQNDDGTKPIIALQQQIGKLKSWKKLIII